MFSLFLLGLSACSTSAAQPPATMSTGPVVVELFTSQGCSSCPPADRVLSELGDDPRVIPLAFHVDYWDDLGWRDPFSSPEWSERQRQYAEAFRKNGVYTPQAVVDGAAEAVGSQGRRLRELIAGAPALPVTISLDTRRVDGALEVRATASPALAGGQSLLLAVTESGLETRVARGENSGKRLVNDHVVRRLEPLPPTGARVETPAGRKLAIVVLARDDRSGRIVGAARLRP